MTKKALFFDKLENNKVKCTLCNQYCVVSDGKRGICKVRENKDGELYSLVYGKIVAKNVDPIEKKPFFHFMPGTNAYSIGTVGCNFKCLNCQNFEISQNREIIGVDMSPEDIVEDALSNNCTCVAYTYNEPTIFYEFMYDCAKLAKKNKLKNVMVTNGYISPAALSKLAKYIDAVNIDLKFFSDVSYKKVASAKLQPVLDTIKKFYELKVHVEITTLIIPTINDKEDELRSIAKFIAAIDKQIPWHVSSFYPLYKLSNLPRTSFDILKRAYEIGKEEGLNYVYVGNVTGVSENTYCPKCNRLLIERVGYIIVRNELLDTNTCDCGQKIYITN